MGRLVGYMANRADRLHDVLVEERDVLAPPPDLSFAGWGVGFYQGGEVLHKKRPLLVGERVDWEQISKDVRTDCAVVHLRQATVGDFRTENTHPFRMRSWLFAHNGTIHHFERMRPQLVDQLPDFLRRNIRGTTDSEHFFHVLLSFLHDAGQLDNPNPPEDTVLHAIRSALQLTDRLSAEVHAPTGTLNHVLTNGRRMYAVRRGAPMYYAARTGLRSEETHADPSSASAFRFVLVMSDGPSSPVGYTELDEGAVCVVDRDLHVAVRRL